MVESCLFIAQVTVTIVEQSVSVVVTQPGDPARRSSPAPRDNVLHTFTGETSSQHITTTDILVLGGTAGAGGMAPPARTRFSAKLKRVQTHSSHVNIL